MVFKHIQNPEKIRHNCQHYSYTEVKAQQLHATSQRKDLIYIMQTTKGLDSSIVQKVP